jgi:hypothetical protein
LLCVGVGNAALSRTGGRTAFRSGFAGAYYGHFIRFFAEYSGEPVPVGIYLAPQAGLETFPGLAYNY